MKKFILLLSVASLLSGVPVEHCRADYADLKDQVDTVADVWLGGYLNSHDNSVNRGFAERQKPLLPETANRQASLKASEFYSLDSSASGGVLIKGAPLPNRYHLELDYYNSDDWFGDLRYSYKDYLQIRLLPRRFFHNLDNVRIYDFDPTAGGTDVEINDTLVDDYGVRVDIDQYHLRLKTPDFPMHLYSDGEIVRRKGKRQMLFLGGAAYFTNRLRVSEAREIDQEKQEIGIGANAHLGPVEVDFSHRSRQFDSDLPAPTYGYIFGASEHNATPELKADTNTVKIHSSHTGRIFASATYSEIDKTNEGSGAEAENAMGYGEVVWLPAAYLSFTAKYRNQKNKATAPATVEMLGRNPDGTFGIRTYTVHPGVESTTDTGSLRMRYSLIPSTNVNLQYTNQVKEVDDQSAVDWARPPKQTRNIYELGFTNWAVPKVRVTGKYRHTNIDTEFGDEALIEPVNNDPDHINHGNLALTWLVSPRISSYFSASLTKEDTNSNRIFTGITEAEQGTAVNKVYLASASYALSEKLVVTPTYTYMSWKQKREMVWQTNTGGAEIDSGYSNRQKAHNYALNLAMKPVKRLDINSSFEYTITKGSYRPTTKIDLNGTVPFVFTLRPIGAISKTDTKELTLRLDSDFDLGRGWGLGLDLRYTDWRDESSDNPSDGTFAGGLLRVTKQFFY